MEISKNAEGLSWDNSAEYMYSKDMRSLIRTFKP